MWGISLIQGTTPQVTGSPLPATPGNPATPATSGTPASPGTPAGTPATSGNIF